MNKVTKAIFPVAGLGTRFLPATKSIPKEIMTLVDRPLIQYAIDEAREAGIEDFIFVTARGKSALENYFDEEPELEALLEARGDDDLLELLRATNMDSGQIAYIRQNHARGLGHAVWCARRLISPGESFAVILPDDVILADVGCISQMMEAHDQTGGSMVAAMEVPKDQTSAYGIIDVAEDMGTLVRAKGMVEKPDPNESTSNLAIIGRYILTNNIFHNLENAATGTNGEIQLTDAIAQEIKNCRNVYGFKFQGERFDCGSKLGFIKATLSLSLKHPDIRTDVLNFMNKNVIK